ncbi:alpha/beta hydrolase family protein [Epilithonimonas hungarica]|uniref:Dienelactone hydrolase n=1 Tax=Epilithonimonas hungarica TaxID=454006 RepID=A0A1G7RAZ2_9FLAO|nr:alpha/beta fold hydrolase [Epilithonimonas hungarica]MDP9955596.1 dienelactone hydrolase [Epilithonimonas hungarica]SDG07893.1 Dienelactone hydrolase [Epilithonimonas hungarica]
MKGFNFILWILLINCLCGCSSTASVSVNHSSEILNVKHHTYKTINFPTSDELTVYADYYSGNGKRSPLIILYHQAGFSRGAFRNIAPRLVELGFNVLAVDLRSGDMVNHVINLTQKEALKKGKSTAFTDVIPDLEATYYYAKNKLKAKKIIYWGSSYSASLGFYMAAKHPSDYKALIAYSPGEYFKIENKSISTFAKDVKIPVYISSARNEESNWRPIYNALETKKDFYLPSKTAGHHGTFTLSSFYDDAEENWQTIIPFLKKLK